MFGKNAICHRSRFAYAMFRHVLKVKNAVKDEQSKQKPVEEAAEPHPEFSKLLRESTMPSHDRGELRCEKTSVSHRNIMQWESKWWFL